MHRKPVVNKYTKNVNGKLFLSNGMMGAFFYLAVFFNLFQMFYNDVLYCYNP